MSTVVTLCETKEWSYSGLMEAVEEFVDSEVDNASTELYEATAKRLLGETLSHDEIMLDVPICGPDDLIVLERAPHANDVKFSIGTDTQIRTMLTRLKLGRKGLLSMYKTYLELEHENPTKGEGYLMGKAGQMHGLNPRESQVILTKMIAKHNLRKEHFLQMADDVLVEETPTNTSGSANPDHKPTDGGKTRLGTKTVKRRKKLTDFKGEIQ